MSTFAPSSFDRIRALDAEHGMQTYGRLPVAFVRGEGVKLWDSEVLMTHSLSRRSWCRYLLG